MLKLALENVQVAVDRELKYLAALEQAELLQAVKAYCHRRLEHPVATKAEKTRQGSGKRGNGWGG